MVIAERILARLGAPRRSAAAVIGALPPYRIALWPDGWQLDADGSVRIFDTHCMAEARRWLEVADRSARGQARGGLYGRDLERAMRMHGIYVPRALIGLAGRRFASEEVASVAVQLVAGDWVGERRRQLLAAPAQALAEHALAWSGSRHAGTPDAQAATVLVAQLIRQCIDEGLLPDASYRLDARCDDGYGVRRWRFRVDMDLAPDALRGVEDALNAAMIPYNRAVMRDGAPVPVMTLSVRSRDVAA
jgi:hypothetical protein